MIVTRCSALDRNMVCGASLLPTDTPYNPQSIEGKEGTAGHAILAQMVLGQEPDIDGISAQYHVDKDTLRFFLYRASMVWTTIGPSFLSPRAEQPLSADFGDVRLTGHTDVDSIVRGKVLVLDWKLGWQPSDHPYQLLGYCALGAEEHKNRYGFQPEQISGFEVHIRGGTIEAHHWEQKDIDLFTDELQKRARHTDQYGPGASCRFCPHQNTCIGRQQWVHSSVQSMVTTKEGITPQKIADLWDQAKELGRALDSYREIARQVVAENGPLDLGNGKQLEIIESKRDRIIPSKALKIMREEMKLTRSDIDCCVRISKGGLLAIAKGRARKGKGAQAERETLAMLENACAIDSIVFSELRATKKPKDQNQ